jgi:K+-transporting ATPase ATPase C chain
MSFSSQLLRAARLTLALWLLTVVLTSLPMLGLARLVANDSANGSLLQRDGVVVGSRLIGQRFSSGRYLNGRPFGNASLSAANPLLTKRVAEAAKRWQAAGIHQPASDLLLDSGSGVDPHISLEAARQQLPGLARERGMEVAQLEDLIKHHLEGPMTLRAIQPVVNVLGFNLALDQLDATSAKGRKA